MQLKSVFSFLSNNKTLISILGIWLVSISGILGIWLGDSDWFLSKTPFNLLLCLLLTFWNFPLKNGWRSILLWSCIYLLGMGVELVGVHTGILFGNYHYGNNLGQKIGGVPLLIGVNWMILTFITGSICKRFIQAKWLVILCSALLMVILDFFIEVNAPIFDFWYWDIGYPPLRNFIDWFIIAVLMQTILQDELYTKKHPFPLHHFTSQLLFFAFFYVIYAF